MSEIANLIEKIYDHRYTPQTVSNMTKVLTEELMYLKSDHQIGNMQLFSGRYLHCVKTSNGL